MYRGKWIPEIDSTFKDNKIGAKTRIRWLFDCVEMPPRSLQTQSFLRKKWLFVKNIAVPKG